MNARRARSHPRNKRCPGRARHSPGQFPARFHTQDGLGTAGPFLPPGRVSFFRGFFPAPVPGAVWKEASFFDPIQKKSRGQGPREIAETPLRAAWPWGSCATALRTYGDTHRGSLHKIEDLPFWKNRQCFFCGLLIFPKKFFLSVTGSPAATFLKVLAKAFSPDYSFPRVAYRLP